MDGLDRLLRKRDYKKREERDQPNRDRKRLSNDTPPKEVSVAKSMAGKVGIMNYDAQNENLKISVCTNTLHS